jgi:hypothetical protein
MRKLRYCLYIWVIGSEAIDYSPYRKGWTAPALFVRGIFNDASFPTNFFVKLELARPIPIEQC